MCLIDNKRAARGHMGRLGWPLSRLGSRVSEGGAAPDRSGISCTPATARDRSEEGGAWLDGSAPRRWLGPRPDSAPGKNRWMPRSGRAFVLEVKHCHAGIWMVRRVDGLKLECTRCRVMKPRGQFAVRESRTGRGVQRDSWCRECRAPQKAAAAHRRRERAIGRGTFTAGDIRRLYELQYGLCHWCQKSLSFSGYCVDHVIPLVRGGSNTRFNLVLACPHCNLTRKGGR
jgi:5-methylcytosine-specific restriction endonuclease McrA